MLARVQFHQFVAPPTIPPTAKDYSDVGMPWFDLYQDGPAVGGSETLGGEAAPGASGFPFRTKTTTYREL